MSKNKGTYYINAAQKGGCTVKNGCGDHVKIYPPKNANLPDNFRSPLVIPSNLKGNGTECFIKKWLKAVGILVTLSLGGIAIYIVWL